MVSQTNGLFVIGEIVGFVGARTVRTALDATVGRVARTMGRLVNSAACAIVKIEDRIAP